MRAHLEAGLGLPGLSHVHRTRLTKSLTHLPSLSVCLAAELAGTDFRKIAPCTRNPCCGAEPCDTVLQAMDSDCIPLNSMVPCLRVSCDILSSAMHCIGCYHALLCFDRAPRPRARVHLVPNASADQLICMASTSSQCYTLMCTASVRVVHRDLQITIVPITQLHLQYKRTHNVSWMYTAHTSIHSTLAC